MNFPLFTYCVTFSVTLKVPKINGNIKFYHSIIQLTLTFQIYNDLQNPKAILLISPFFPGTM